MYEIYSMRFSNFIRNLLENAYEFTSAYILELYLKLIGRLDFQHLKLKPRVKFFMKLYK